MFSRATVTGPDGEFVTQVLSLPDGLVLTQHDAGGIQLVAGFDADGTWLYDPASGAVRPLDDKWQVFLIGHDLQRLWQAPQSRWAGSGKRYTDTAGRPARFSRYRDHRPTRLKIFDGDSQPIQIELAASSGDGTFDGATIQTSGGLYSYRYTAMRLVRPPHATAATSPAQAELLRLHRVQRMAHLGELPGLLARGPLLEIRDGATSTLESDALRLRFQRYFHAVEFSDWYDREPPVLRVSDDGTMAWKAVTKTVALKRDDDIALQDFAWLETWQRTAGTWRLAAIASTRARTPPQ